MNFESSAKNLTFNWLFLRLLKFGVMKMILRIFILFGIIFGMIFGITFGIIHRDNQLKWFCRVRAGGSSESMTKTGLFTQSWIDWNQKQKKMGIEYSIPRMSEATGSTWGPIRYWIQKISKLFVDESIVIRIKQNQNYSFETIDFFVDFNHHPQFGYVSIQLTWTWLFDRVGVWRSLRTMLYHNHYNLILIMIRKLKFRTVDLRFENQFCVSTWKWPRVSLISRFEIANFWSEAWWPKSC